MMFGNFVIKTKSDLINVINEYGFIPFFENSISGFSIEEHISSDCWWHSDTGQWSAWEWKGPVIRECGCAYGKFFENRAVFISREWFPDFANYRRDGYDFDARWDDGLTSYRDKDLYELLAANAPVVSTVLKERGNYGKGGRKGFETLITRLQAQAYVLISDFVYPTNKAGRPYGWGLAQYSTPELFFGPSFRETVYDKAPEESRERILQHLKNILPQADEQALNNLLYEVALFNFSQFLIRDFDLQKMPVFGEGCALRVSGFVDLDEAEWWLDLVQKNADMQAVLIGTEQKAVTEINLPLVTAK